MEVSVLWLLCTSSLFHSHSSINMIAAPIIILLTVSTGIPTSMHKAASIIFFVWIRACIIWVLLLLPIHELGGHGVSIGYVYVSWTIASVEMWLVVDLLYCGQVSFKLTLGSCILLTCLRLFNNRMLYLLLLHGWSFKFLILIVTLVLEAET